MGPNQQHLKISKVVVTGSEGFIGCHVVDALRSRGVAVWRMHRASVVSDARTEADICLDLRDGDAVEQALLEVSPDCIIHLAGSKNRGESIGDYRENYQVNLLNTLNVLHASRLLSSLKRFLFIGSCDEYGSSITPFHEGLCEKPNNAYGLSKLATTQLLTAWHRIYDFPVAILRPSVVYGPGQGNEMFIPSLAMTIGSGVTFAMTKGEQIRDFLFVDDLVEAIIKAACHHDEIHGMVINIGSGSPSSIRDVAVMIADQIGPEARNLLSIGALPYRPNEVMNYSLSIERAATVLGWYPVTKLDEGLRRTLAYINGKGCEP